MTEKYIHVRVGRTQLFCCGAQMYLHATGWPSTAMEFCAKCNGDAVEPIYQGPDYGKWPGTPVSA